MSDYTFEYAAENALITESAAVCTFCSDEQKAEHVKDRIIRFVTTKSFPKKLSLTLDASVVYRPNIRGHASALAHFEDLVAESSLEFDERRMNPIAC